jgi:ATP-dependent Lhr-like helicase
MSMTPLLALEVEHGRNHQEGLRSLARNESTIIQKGMDDFLSRQARFGLPAPGEVLVEAFLLEDGERALVFHLVAGRRINEALARALAWRMAATDWRATDLGFALVSQRAWKPNAGWLEKLLAGPLEPDLRAALSESEILKRRFRHVATRALLILKREDVPLSQRQREANGLLHRLSREAPDHPVLEETWREALHDALDLDGAEASRAKLPSCLRWMPTREFPSPMGIRVLLRSDNPEGHESIRDAETFGNALAPRGDL